MAELTPDARRIANAQRELASPARRRFTRQVLTLGGLTLLTGCEPTGKGAVDTTLRGVSRFNDAAQAWLFDPGKLAPTYPESMITRPFPFNAYYDIDQVPDLDAATFRLQVSGLVADRRTWTLQQLRALPQHEQVTRLICIEGWSAIGKWAGASFAMFLKQIGADTTARYVSFQCADDYSTSIDMPTALHPQTLLALRFDGQQLLPKYGFPLRLIVPTKLGYKSPKHIVALQVTNAYPGGYWENQGYNWFSGS
jgi:DMSO/TMAO reductase YedYZ molybdopterin-dependent catalytic subunit